MNYHSDGKVFIGCEPIETITKKALAFFSKRKKGVCTVCRGKIYLPEHPLGPKDEAVCHWCIWGLSRGLDPRKHDDFAGWDLGNDGKPWRILHLHHISKGARGQIGTWFVVADQENPFDDTSATKEIVWVNCPTCGGPFTLENHGIDKDGNVSPSIVCPLKAGRGCYHEFAQLDDWNRPEQLETRRAGDWTYEPEKKEKKKSKRGTMLFSEERGNPDYWNRGGYH